MRICVPCEGNEGLGAAVSGHLGRAPFLTLVDTESDEVTVIPNAPHDGGSCAPAAPLAGRVVDAMVCPGAGRRAVMALEAAGIRVLLTDAVSVEQAVADARRGGLRALHAQEACAGRHGSDGPERHRCHRGEDA
jgi:predicted Fe-Mo cluster-binding NifX family protein